MSKDQYSAQQVADAIRQSRGLKSHAAQRLGCSRNTVDRYIKNYASVREAHEEARQARGPDDFILRGAYKNQWAQIGNSVPPKFMQAIAEHIQYMILSEADDFTKKPSQALATDGIDV